MYVKQLKLGDGDEVISGVSILGKTSALVLEQFIAKSIRCSKRECKYPNE